MGLPALFPNPSGGECECDGNTKKDKRTEVSMKKYTHEKAHEEIDYIFKTLLPQRGMAERPEQIRLCHSILDAMLDGSIALCDAGTGIGKTFAYLTAGILHGKCRAAEGKPQRPILISTSSIALQNAIQKEYLPLLSGVLLSEGLISAPIEAVIRKGKAHYACDARLERRVRQVEGSHKNPAARQALHTAWHVLDLDQLSGMSSYDRERICVPKRCNCRRKDCRYRCFLDACQSGQYTVQICNHNLLLADLIHRSQKKKPLLPDSAAIIIDEAHKLPETARQMFGVMLTAQDFAELIRSLHVERYVLAAELLSEAVAPLTEKLSVPVEEGAGFDAYQMFLERPHQVLTVICRQLEGLLTRETWRLLSAVASTVSLFYLGNPEMIFYAADDDHGGAMLCGTVSELATQLQATLWRQEQPIVLTSGTLAVGRDFNRFRTATGLTGERPVMETVCPSPFDYQHNCLLYLPPAPIPLDAADYYDRLAAQIRQLAAASHGHALVLFTSYLAMSAVKERLQAAALPYPVFTMGRRPARTLAAFRAATGSILLATGAAWEGLDFAGDGVSLLIIPRLPFAYPDAVKEKERENYPNLREFLRSVVVPEMQIKLRQGFGRAIRTETDTCAVAMLDPRAARGRRYFQCMKDALPEMPVTGSLRAVEQFYRNRKDAGYFHLPSAG